MSHEEIRELLALYALGSLPESEARVVEAHLEACAGCRLELAELADTLGILGLGAEPASPSPELRRRILGSVAKLGGDAEQAVGRRTSDLMRTGASTWASTVPWAGLGAGVLAAAFAMYMWGARERLATTEQQLARERDTAEFLSAPETVTLVLSGTDAAPRARARLAYDRRTGRALLFAYDLPPAPEGKAYQLWCIVGGKPMPGQVFHPDASGRGLLGDEIPAEGRQGSIFAVTIEPASGMPQPTGEMVLKGAVDS